MFEAISDFIYKYYISPIIHDSGYNSVNTVTWAIILLISLFGILKLLDKLDIRIDRRFIYSLIPFIYVGSSFRVIEDAEIASPPLKYLLITPLIYFLIAAIVISSLILGYYLKNRDIIDEKQMVLISGSLISVFNSIILVNFGLNHTINYLVPIKIISLAIAVFIPLYFAIKVLPIDLLKNKLYSLILGVHLFDASSTFIGYSLGATEKHVVPTFFINLTGTAAVMYPLKIITILFALWIILKVFEEEEQLGKLTLLVLLVLGLAPALRNTLRLTLGV